LNAKFFARLRASLFNGSLTQAQVDGINAIEKAWKKHGDGDTRKLAYLLATAFHETARTMQPVRETLAKTDAKAKEILTKAWKAGKLPWVKRDYWSSGWFGRGYVQLTHEVNYRKASQKLGVDLIGNPSLAMRPDIAAAILVRGCMEGWFTGKKLGDYTNFTQMRRVVNGTDRAAIIAGYAMSFEAALRR
jgi:predicted chitinase